MQDLANRAPIPFTQRGTSFSIFGSDDSIDRGGQLGQMEKVSTLFSIVDLIATEVASVDWHLYRKTREQNPEEERTEVFDHPALVVWDEPASVEGQTVYTQDEFIEAAQQHYELTGEIDIVLEQKSMGRLSAVTDMWPVRPDRITPVKSRDKFIAGYIYKVGSDEIPLDLSQVITEKRQNPRDPWRGLSPIPSLLADIRGEKAAAQWNANFFANGAVPGGTLELGLDAMLTDEEWDAMMRRWRAQHQGTSNAHRVALIEMGKYTENKISQRDMEFTDLRNFSRGSMMEAYRISKANLGHVEDVNRANNEGQEVRLSTKVVIPRLERWKKLLNTKLLPHFGPDAPLNYEFDYDSPVPVDAADSRLQERANVLNAIALIEQGADWDETLEAFSLPQIPRVMVPAAGSSDGRNPAEGQEINVEPGSIDEPGSDGGVA